MVDGWNGAAMTITDLGSYLATVYNAVVRCWSVLDLPSVDVEVTDCGVSMS